MTEQDLKPADGQGQAKSANGAAATPSYDFEEAQRISSGQLRAWRQIQERFGKDFAIALSALTRKTVKFAAAACEEVASGALSVDSGQESENALWIAFEAHPLNEWAVVKMDSDVVSALLELLLGGTAAAASPLSRELTEIELSVLQDLHGVIGSEMEKAWRPTSRMTFQVVEQQAGRPSGRLARSAKGALSSSLDLEIEGRPGQLTFFYPIRMARTLATGEPAGAADRAARPESPERAIFERLKPAGMTLEGRLHGSTVRLRDLTGLRTGDLLCLEAPLDQAVDILVNGAQRFSGRLSDTGRKRAIRIQDVIPPKGMPS